MPKCKGCLKEIKWVDTPNGKKLPLDVEPINAIEVKENIGVVINVYIPHWATCTMAHRFKRKAWREGGGHGINS